MGCVASRIDKEERVRICKERKRLMKQLVVFRGEFAVAQLAYLRSLKNTGVTLRQFTESESLELEHIPCNRVLPPSPPSPPTPFPPSPPPPPPFSPELRKSKINPQEVTEEESIETDDDNKSSTPPPPPILSSSWEYWDPFGSSSTHHQKCETVEPAEEENWAEAKTEFEEEDREEELVSIAAASPRPGKHQVVELADDNSSMMSWHTKDTADMGMVVWRNKKSLEGIVKELDDYFLKASGSGNQIAILLGITRGDISLPLSFKEKRMRCNSAKVFSALSWSWSSRSPHYTRHAAEFCGSTEPCRPGAHWITLDKLYAAEQKLYKEVKEEEITKLEHERKSMLLIKLEEENHDWMRIEKTRSSVEGLEADIRRLQHSIYNTCSSILTLIDEELYPQLDALTSGLMHMWRTMYECHQVQNHISQQLNHLTYNQNTDMTSDYYRQATAQLETEVTSWYNSLCKLITSQRGYVKTLSKWIQLTDYCLVDDLQQSSCSSAVRGISKEWQHALDSLPDKIASEAIKSLLSAIQAIIQQQAEEHTLHKKSDKLEKRLQKELVSLNELKRRLEGSFPAVDPPPNLSPRHPLSVKLAKTEALKKRAETEMAKYENSIQVTRAMILNNLKTSLPNVFQALISFSSASSRAFEAIHSHAKLTIASEHTPK